MKVIQRTIVSPNPPKDKNVTWIDTSSPDASVEKIFQNGEWLVVGAAKDYNSLENKPKINNTDLEGNVDNLVQEKLVSGETIKTVGGLSLLGEGNIPLPEGSVIVVQETGTSTEAIMSQKACTDTFATQEDYARKDGYYSQLTAGSAENLVGQTVDSEAYLIRPTGDDSNEVANGVARVIGMEGNSCVWNQQAQIPINSFSQNNVTIANNKVTHVSDGSGLASSQVYYNQNVDFNIVIGHVYYISADLTLNFNGGTPVGIGIGFAGNVNANGRLNLYTITSSGRSSRIITASYAANTPKSVYFNWLSTDASSIVSGATFTAENIMFVDLTLLGIDNLTTVAEVEAWLAQHVGTKPYYAYNAGTILSAQTLGIKTYGQNLLNPTTKQAKLIPYSWEENSNVYTIKNVPSGATATFTHDNTGVAETVDISGGSLDITSYGSGILELSAATADTYVCMKWDEQKDDDVVPYEDHTYDFDVRKVYGKVSGAGEYVQCYPNGMRSAGSVHDTLNGNEAVSKIGSVDLGTLTWNRNSITAANVYRTVTSGIPNIKQTLSRQLLCSKYPFAGGINSQSNMPDKSIDNNILVTTSVDILIKDSGYPSDTTTLEQFKEAMNGVMLYYELATPITYTDLIYRDGGIDRPLADVLMNIEVNNWSMEEQLMTPYDGQTNQPTSIPATIKTQYGMDAVEAIDTLQKTCYFADDVRANLQALLTCINTNCAETLGGTFSISDTATDKVFEFTFTPNTEPEP